MEAGYNLHSVALSADEKGVLVWEYDLLTDYHEEDGTIFGKRERWWFNCSEDDPESIREIDGKEYRMVYCEGEEGSTASRRTQHVWDEDWSLPLRRENGRVYTNYRSYMTHVSNLGCTFGVPDYIPYHLTDDGELVLYDYNMEVGDKYRSVEGHDDISVTAKDMVTLLDGREHRRLTLSNGMVLIEGLGCINSPGMLFSYLNPLPDPKEDFCFLNWMYMGDYDDHWGTPQNPVFLNEGIAWRDVNTKHITGHVTDNNGRGIEGATVEVTREFSGNTVCKAVTNAEGAYDMTFTKRSGEIFQISATARGYSMNQTTVNMSEFLDLTQDFVLDRDLSGVNSTQDDRTTRQPCIQLFFDLQGRRLTTIPAKGLYIQNGRKRAVK